MTRISFDEGAELFCHAPLEILQERAETIRYQKNPEKTITYVLDSNPNYTNVCKVGCAFCAFWRNSKAVDAYTKSVDEVMEHLEFASREGLTTVLLQGGLNDDLRLEYYVTLIKESRKRYPNINPHFFTAPEIWHCAEVSGITYREVLQALYDAGQRTLPGGGAEILSERVHKIVSPKKIPPQTWIDIHKTAHEIGFRSTATMMYGHIEEAEDILIHLDRIRTLQDETRRFTAFIPWSYKSAGSPLQKKIKKQAGPEDYFRILAFARIYLDNFDHIQASWFSEGKKTGCQALHFGADDFGGLVMEENVHRSANWINKTTQEEIKKMIIKEGFEPVERNTLYAKLP